VGRATVGGAVTTASKQAAVRTISMLARPETGQN